MPFQWREVCTDPNCPAYQDPRYQPTHAELTWTKQADEQENE